MDFETLQTQINELDTTTRNILRLCAVGDRSFYRNDLLDLATRLGWSSRKGRKIASKDITLIVDELLEKKFLDGSSYNSVMINTEIQDLAIQDAVEDDAFQSIVSGLRAKYRWAFTSTDQIKDQRIAFYCGDTDAFMHMLSPQKTYEHLNLLHPFNDRIFNGLPDELKKWHLIDSAPRVLTNCDDSPDFMSAFNEWLAQGDALDHPFIATGLDIGLARGDLNLLKTLNEQTQGNHPEIQACISLLKGDTKAFADMLLPMMPGGKKRRGKLGPHHRLPGIFMMLVLLARGTANALAQAEEIFKTATSYHGRYRVVAHTAHIGIEFKQFPVHSLLFKTHLSQSCKAPLSALTAGYVVGWCLAPGDNALNAQELLDAISAFEKLGLDWLAAELLGLEGRSSENENAQQCARKAQEIHNRLGTGSIIELTVAAPSWRRSLDAMMALAQGDTKEDDSSATERMIWEWDPGESPIDLAPYHQKKTRNGWSMGRKVGLARLFENFSDTSEFGFLTAQDMAICQTLGTYVTRNYSYYPETHYAFDEEGVAAALVGHPCIFLPGDRDTPIEIRKKTPQLKMARKANGAITLSMEPSLDIEFKRYRVIVDAEHQVSIIFFNDRQFSLHKLLNGTLTAPADAVDDLIKAAQKLASIIPVHSEIGAEASPAAPEGKHVVADSTLQIHLSPTKAGLQAEVFVYPFRTSALMYHPGQGGANVFTHIDGQPLIAVRNPANELTLKNELLAACPTMASFVVTDNAFYMPTVTDALDVLLELEPLVEQNAAQLHWPEGKPFSLAGRASMDGLGLNIRKKKNLFEVSGKLTVNDDFTLELMRIIDLLETSPARYIKLENNRFLALTDTLRRHIEALAMYGDKRVGQNSLQFPNARTAALEALAADAKVRADRHWKAWTAKIREANALQIHIPSTLQAELREYQQDGFYGWRVFPNWDWAHCWRTIWVLVKLFRHWHCCCIGQRRGRRW
ncbi:MAG: hypothetical protein JXR76_20620 [Deltaproteobacteria bacterium]|nr:hypothetical protein [Deltaproteobacteria bacterium]